MKHNNETNMEEEVEMVFDITKDAMNDAISHSPLKACLEEKRKARLLPQQSVKKRCSS